MAEDEDKKEKEDNKNIRPERPDFSKLGQCCTWECSTDGGTC